jgi:FAD/FMN-containing dehydrogenase
MGNMPVTTTMGMDARLKASDGEAFKARVRGQVLGPSDAGYDTARKVWNGMIDKHPTLIARCTGVADVLEAVRFAREHQLLVAVRGGGHNFAGYATCDGGLVIDLSPMKGIQVNPTQRTARAQAGVTWGELDRETQAFDLAVTGGTDPTTGIAGLTLGGGIGWLQGRYGLTCDNLLSADVVTAEGQFLTASAAAHPDLFWGLRGGSGNFGIVTAFEYRLHPVGPLLGGMVLHPFAKAAEVLRFYREYTTEAPDELTAAAGVLTAQDGHLMVGILASYCGPLAEGERVLKPLRAFGPPVHDDIRPMTYEEIQKLLYVFEASVHSYLKAGFLQGLTEEAIATIVAHCATKSSPMSAVALLPINGAAARVAPTETAFVHRQHHYHLFIISQWREPAESDRHLHWTREFWAAMQPFAGRGVYVNELGYDEGEDRFRAAYGANYDRLVRLKNTYDPTNVFRLNPNIKPTAAPGESVRA